MKEHLGVKRLDIHLADGATLENLMEYFDTHLSSIIPQFLWNKQKKEFRGPVLISIDQKVVRVLQTPLKDGQEIRLVKAATGG